MLLGFYIFILIIAFAFLIFFVGSPRAASKSSPKTKFYDFNEQLVDGQISKPTALYTDARQKVKFDRLIRLKKSFLKDLFSTAKEKVFK